MEFFSRQQVLAEKNERKPENYNGLSISPFNTSGFKSFYRLDQSSSCKWDPDGIPCLANAYESAEQFNLPFTD